MSLTENLPRRRFPGMAAMLFFVAHSTAAAADDSSWSRFRGPNGQGVAAAQGSTPAAGSPLYPARLEPSEASWRRPLPPGHSSPIVQGGRIFLTGFVAALPTEQATNPNASPKEDGAGELVTLALDLRKGTELWRRSAPRPRNETLDTRNGPAAPSPAVDSQRVVVFFGDYGLLSYDHEGNELWRVPLGPFSNLYGIGASPVLQDGRVYLVVDQHKGSYVACFDARDGRELWRTQRPEATSGHSTPVLWLPPGADTAELQLLVPGSFFFTAYRAADGERLWWVRGLSFEMKSTPALGHGLAYINGYGSQFNEEGQTVRTTPWEQAVAGDKDGDGKLAVDEMVDDFSRDWFDFNDLSGDGTLDAAEWKYFRDALATRNNIMAIRLPQAAERGDLTRSHIAWQHFRSVPQLPSPILVGEVLLMINDRGITTTFTARTGEVINQGRVGDLTDSIYASPVAADGRIYLAGRSGRVAVVSADGSLEPLATSDFDEQIVATPALVEGSVLLRTDQALYRFTTASPPDAP